jgi:hypothetical protein
MNNEYKKTSVKIKNEEIHIDDPFCLGIGTRRASGEEETNLAIKTAIMHQMFEEMML